MATIQRRRGLDRLSLMAAKVSIVGMDCKMITSEETTEKQVKQTMERRRAICARLSRRPPHNQGIFKHAQSKLQVIVPRRGCGHVGFGPSRAGIVNEGLTGAAGKLQQRVPRGFKSARLLIGRSDEAGGDSAGTWI